MPDDPKRIAAAILGPAMEPDVDDGGGPSDADSDDAETSALGATADEMMGALESGDRRALVDALRSLMMLMRG